MTINNDQYIEIMTNLYSYRGDLVIGKQSATSKNHVAYFSKRLEELDNLITELTKQDAKTTSK